MKRFMMTVAAVAILACVASVTAMAQPALADSGKAAVHKNGNDITVDALLESENDDARSSGLYERGYDRVVYLREQGYAVHQVFRGLAGQGAALELRRDLRQMGYSVEVVSTIDDYGFHKWYVLARRGR